MKSVLLAVPSKGRSEAILNQTFSWLQHITDFDFKIFVEPQDYESYCDKLGATYLINLEENNRKLGFSKLKIQKYAKDNGYKYIFKIDDDLNSFTFKETWGNENFKSLEKLDKKRVIADLFSIKLKELVKLFEENEQLGLINFCHSSDVFKKDEMKLLGKVNSFMGTIYLFRTELMHSKRLVKDVEKDFSSFPVCLNINEDNVTFLSVLDEGYKTLKTSTMIFSNSPMFSNEGGHQSKDFSRKELVLSSTNLLVEKYFKKLSKKDFKGYTVPDFSKYIKGMSVKEGETLKQCFDRYDQRHSLKIKEFFS